MKPVQRLFCYCALLSATACTTYAPSDRFIGRERSDMVEALGPPERVVTEGDYQVLHYPRGPAGSETYFVYLGKDDRVLRWEQVLTERKFDSILAGMTKDQVISTIGISKITNGLARDRGYVWHYRYKNEICRSFMVEFTPEDIVRSTHYIIRGGRRCKYVGPM